jgi:hypothetical protein
MKIIKRVLAWVLVLLVAYVVTYSYLHPEELVYREDVYTNYLIEDHKDIPLVPLVKDTNPFVYFFLNNQGLIFMFILIYALLDYKKSIASLRKFGKSIKRFIKIKD